MQIQEPQCFVTSSGELVFCVLCACHSLPFLISRYCYMWKGTLKSYKNVIHVSVSEYSFYCHIQCFEIFFICNKGCFLMCVCQFLYCLSLEPILKFAILHPVVIFLPLFVRHQFCIFTSCCLQCFCLVLLYSVCPLRIFSQHYLFLYLLCSSCVIFMYLHIPNACMLHAVQTSWT